MKNEHIKHMIDAIKEDKSKEEFASHFDKAMLYSLNEKLEAKRKEIAQSMFNKKV